MGQPASNFLGLEGTYCDVATAQYAVLPIPYEGTATYALGTASGPEAILDASQHVELLDEELLAEFFAAGIATYPPIPPSDDAFGQMQRIRETARGIVKEGKFLLSLGGEHSITAPLVEVCAEAHGPLSVLQIDAHADLRDSYGGSKYSHACVMRRVLEIADSVCQVGLRSFSREELLACPEEASRFVTAAIIARDGRWMDRVLGMLGQRVYVTVDMDGLDPSLAPGVGTPEPGGLTWPQVTGLLRRICTERQVVAADIVEVRPIPPNHLTEFVAARLAYKIIAYSQLPGR